MCCGRTTVSCAFFPLCAFFGQKWLRSWVYPFICVNFNMIIFVYSQELLLLHNIVWKEHSTKRILPQFKYLRFLVPLQNDALSCLKRSKLLANWFARNWDCLLSHFQTHARHCLHFKCCKFVRELVERLADVQVALFTIFLREPIDEGWCAFSDLKNL